MVNPLREQLLRVRRRITVEWSVSGLALILLAVLALLGLSAWVLVSVEFAGVYLLLVRVLLAVATGWLLWRFLVRFWVRPPDLRLVARFLESRYPQFQERLSAAVELEERRGEPSPFLPLLRQSAYRELRRIELPRMFWPRRTPASLAAIPLLLGIGAWLYLSGPPEFGYSLYRLAAIADPNVAPLYQLEVSPGSVTIAKGSSVNVRVVAVGFDPAEVSLQVRRPGAIEWERIGMQRAEDGVGFRFLLPDVREAVSYYAEAEGVRSAVFTLDVVDFPQAVEVQFHLRFPTYTGLPDATLENTTLLRALKGTEVDVLVASEPAASTGVLRFEDGVEARLSPTLGAAGTLQGSFTVVQDTVFRIHLANDVGLYDQGSEEYVIEAEEDQPPSVFFTHPGRDRPVTVLEEVYTEIAAEDDFGIRELELVYSLNGGPERTVPLAVPAGARKTSVSHTFYLEEWEGLQPGDFISYYARARDASSSAASDLFFLEIEPFERSFRQMQAAAAQGQGEGLQFAARQKQIIIATHTLLQETGLDRAPVAEDSATLALVQERLTGEVQAVLDRIRRRNLGDTDARFQHMSEYLESALEHMQPAAASLRRAGLEEALPEEQKAYQMLSRAEKLFTEMQVAMSSGPAGASSARDLADLIDLELDQTKNQYETLQQSRKQRREQALEDALERLRRLAQRQQQELERRTRQGYGAGDQQDVREEAERLARELARLSRERNDPELGRIGRRLERLSRQLRQSAGAVSERSVQEAARALEQLREAERLLREYQSRDVQDQLSELAASSARLSREQRRLAQEIQSAQTAADTESQEELLAQNFEQVRDLFWRQQDLRQEVQQLESELHATARRLEDSSPRAARALRQAGRKVRETRIPDQMQEAAELLAGGLLPFAGRRAEQAGKELEDLSEQIRQAVGEARQAQIGPQTSPEDVLTRTGRLIERLRELEERLQAVRGGRNEQSMSSRIDSPEGSLDDEAAEARNFDRDALVGMPPSSSAGSRGPDERGAGALGIPGVEPRQLAREWRERIREAVELQQMLQGMDGSLAGEIGRLVENMRRMQPERWLVDQEELARLRSQLIPGFQEAELRILRDLSRGGDGTARTVLIDELPPRYRERVQEYFRRLSVLDGSSDR